MAEKLIDSKVMEQLAGVQMDAGCREDTILGRKPRYEFPL